MENIQNVQPIRDIQTLELFKMELKKRSYRDFMFFYTGLNSGMRISDVLPLQVHDVRNMDKSMKQHITVIEKKTGKVKRFPLCNGLLAEMEKYTKSMNMEDFLFPSRTSNNGSNKPITTTQAYRILTETAEKLGIPDVGTHTMRKSFRLVSLPTI